MHWCLKHFGSLWNISKHSKLHLETQGAENVRTLINTQYNRIAFWNLKIVCSISQNSTSVIFRGNLKSASVDSILIRKLLVHVPLHKFFLGRFDFYPDNFSSVPQFCLEITEGFDPYHTPCCKEEHAYHKRVVVLAWSPGRWWPGLVVVARGTGRGRCTGLRCSHTRWRPFHNMHCFAMDICVVREKIGYRMGWKWGL